MSKHRHRRQAESLEHRLNDIRPNVTTDAVQMQELCLDFKDKELFCGYIRQPIVAHLKGDLVQIGGMCAISDNYCSYNVTRGTPRDNYACPVYKTRMCEK